MKKPTYIKQEIKIDPDDEQKNIQMILGIDSDDDGGECNDDMSNSDSFMPIKIRQSKKFIFNLLIFYYIVNLHVFHYS